MESRLLYLFLAITILSCSDEGTTKVGLQPFEAFDPALADTIALAIEEQYGVEVSVLKTERIPEKAFVNVKSPRYRADKLIAILKDEKPDSLDYIMGLTSLDISTTKKDGLKIKEPASKYEDFGIFGLGYRPGPSSIVSTFRLQGKGRKVLVERIKKIAFHELGHNMGLDHCTSERCVMKDAAESIKTVDKVDARLCDQCKKVLRE